MTSKIEWTELVWNPVTGCTPISEGCQNCYAQRMHKRLQAMGQAKYKFDFNNVKRVPYELNKDFGKKPKLIFVNSMSDLFHKDIPDEFINDVISTCYCHTKHTFQILTKRSERLKDFSYTNLSFLRSNVWLGVSVELAKYKNRIDDLRKTNAKVKFISFEPLLGDVGELDLTGIDWVIVGGESGPGARPMHPDWVRNIRDQAIAQGCKFMFKQWGEHFTNYQNMCSGVPMFKMFKDKQHWINKAASGDTPQIGFNGKIMKCGLDFEDPAVYPVCVMHKVGKKKAGRELDGRIWDEFPER